MRQLHKDIRWYIFHGPSAKQCERSVPVRQLAGAHSAGVEGHFTFPPRFSTSFRHNTPGQLTHYNTVTTLRAEVLYNSGPIPSRCNRISGAFAKLRKTTISIVTSAYPTASNNPAHTGRILMKFDIYVFFSKYLSKIPASLKSDTNNWYFTWRPMHVYDNISLISAQNEKRFRRKL